MWVMKCSIMLSLNYFLFDAHIWIISIMNWVWIWFEFYRENKNKSIWKFSEKGKSNFSPAQPAPRARFAWQVGPTCQRHPTPARSRSLCPLGSTCRRQLPSRAPQSLFVLRARLVSAVNRTPVHSLSLSRCAVGPFCQLRLPRNRRWPTFAHPSWRPPTSLAHTPQLLFEPPPHTLSPLSHFAHSRPLPSPSVLARDPRPRCRSSNP
jgi:hypothetical protein